MVELASAGVESPWTSSRSNGDVVPIPTLPFGEIANAIVVFAPVVEATSKSGLLWPEVAWTASEAQGVVLPIPTEVPLKTKPELLVRLVPLKNSTPLVTPPVEVPVPPLPIPRVPR